VEIITRFSCLADLAMRTIFLARRISVTVHKLRHQLRRGMLILEEHFADLEPHPFPARAARHHASKPRLNSLSCRQDQRGHPARVPQRQRKGDVAPQRVSGNDDAVNGFTVQSFST